MRVQRRLVFATPFVLVAACKKPIAEPVEPDEATQVVAPRDAGLAEVELDAPVDAPAIAERPPLRCGDPGVTCNPPRPQPPCEPPSTCNPPRPVVARIINIVVQGDGVAITTGRGTDDGIAQGWHGCVVDDRERCVLGGNFVVTAANRRTSKATVKLTPDQLRAHPRVKLDPPLSGR